jgi:spore germination cell wall hydrolase CwlJ-like protein
MNEHDSAEALHGELEIDTLARTIWGEARGEGSKGMEAVAAVIMNRVRIVKQKGAYWWGNSVIQICQKPFQFSCWNKDDPNYRKLLAVDASDLSFATALRIARRAMNGALPDPTHGATHYHVAGAEPYWAKGQKPVAVIGRQVFYKIDI